MGSIYQRDGRGPWWIAYIGLDGGQHCESSRNRSAGIKGTHADATRLLNLREGKIAEGIAVTPQTGRLTVEDAVAAVLQDHDVNQRRSKADVERRIKLHIKPYFGAMTRLAAIGTERLREYIADRTKEGASAATCNREMSILRRAFRLALEAERIIAVPKFPMLDESRNVRQGFFEPADFEKVRAKLTPDAYADAASFAYISGWRLPSEVLPLTWNQVVMREGLIRINPGTTKGGEGRQYYRRYHIVAEADIHDAGARLDAATTAKASTTKVLRFRKRARTTKRRTRKIA
jgi:integrase